MQIVKNSVIYLGSSVLNKSIPFLLLPVMTKYLSQQEYGVLSIYMILITFGGAVIGMNINMNISKNFFKVSKDELAIYIGNILIILFLSFGAFFFITFIIISFVDTVFSITKIWLLFIPIICLMMMINNINTTVLRNEGRPYIYGVFEISNTIIKMSVTVLLLVSYNYGWHSQVVGLMAAYFILCIVDIVYLYKRNYINFTIEKSKIISILKLSIPLIPHVLGGVIIAMSDRFFIEHMVSLEAVGLYSVGYMFGMVVMLFTDAFIKSWSPWFYKNLSSPIDNNKQKIVKYTYLYMLLIFMMVVFISALGEYIFPYFVDEKFYSAKEFILWIAIGFGLRGVYQIFFSYLIYIDKTHFLAISTLITVVINLLMNYFLIESYGTIGAAYATIIAWVVSASLVFWYQNKNYDMPWLLKRENEIF